MNSIGNTVVYVNGTKVQNATELQKDILIGNITIGRAIVPVNVTVVYEADGGVCSFRDEEFIEGQLLISWLCSCFHANTCVLYLTTQCTKCT